MFTQTHVLVNKYRVVDRQAGILKEIRYLRRSIKSLIPRASFARLVRDIFMELSASENISR